MSEFTNQKIFLTDEQAQKLESAAEAEGDDFIILYFTQRRKYNMSHPEAMMALPMGIDGFNVRRLKLRKCTIATLRELDKALLRAELAGEDYANRVNLFVYLVCDAGFSVQESIKRAGSSKVVDWSRCTA